MVHHYLNTADATSTSNLRKHAKVCWGEEAIAVADATNNVHAAREALANIGNLRDSSITAAFQRISKDVTTYSHRQHTSIKAR